MFLSSWLSSLSASPSACEKKRSTLLGIGMENPGPTGLDLGSRSVSHYGGSVCGERRLSSRKMRSGSAAAYKSADERRLRVVMMKVVKVG